ncbi:protein GFS12 isoform X2 [Cornus florida]|uniref:protein GFS12 isoform X2 n=1 Tax=Cornus florida TaxID=4283 RepID=UPI002899CCE4|nr:protein GFS12 isoform X2 [Cornus florida]
MGDQMCFECLQSRICADFSDKVIFSHGISDSALPFGSTGVVQMANYSGEVLPQFTLVYLPTREDDCLAKYIDEYCVEDGKSNNNHESDVKFLSVINQDQAEVSVGTWSVETPSLDTKSNESQCLSNGGRKTSLGALGCESTTCNFSGKFSCTRTITALAPIARIGISSYSIFEEITLNLLTGFVEDHVLSSLTRLIGGKATGFDGINFLELLGVPSFNENIFPGCLRHPNVAPILGMLKTPNYINLVLPKTPYTLENILHYSPDAIKSEWHIRFLIYQLLSALAHMHGLGVAHGNICPSSIMLTDSCWSWLCVVNKSRLCSKLGSTNEDWSINPSRIGYCIEDCLSQGLYADLKLFQSIDWHSGFDLWWRGELSNFEYLLILNRLSGRRWGDHTFHTVMPWVIDFSVKPDENNDVGWRDLTKSKWRLAKGDEQLDFTYSTSEFPHHVSDECLSELAVCSYKSRRLPLSVLRMAVRSVYEPNEYPSTMQRLYQWTPDECIPELYCDPQIFYSLHSGMTDLAVPSWAGSPEEFIKVHRDALESYRVSCQIHHWIDITFGYKMSGQAALAAKNVMLPALDPTMPRSVGRRQLFTQPHPARQVVTRKSSDTANEVATPRYIVNEIEAEKPLLRETANLQELEAAAAFCEHAQHLSPLYCYHIENLVKNDSFVEEPPSESLVKNIFRTPDFGCNNGLPSTIDFNFLLENIEVDDDNSMGLGYQELLLWRQKSSCSRTFSEDIAKDIFSIGCILAELYLRRPLFDSTSLAVYLEDSVLPRLMHELPPHTEVLVEACIRKDWRRRPSAKCLLESPYFPTTVRSSYLFLAPLQLLAKDGSRLCYAASFAKQGALRAMGTFAAEMCAPYCLPLVESPLSDTEAEWACILLKEFLKCLKSKAVKKLIVPTIRKILQATGYSHLKVSLLQDSFVREIWNRIGKQAYLETIHPLVISNLYIAPHKSSAAAASVLLIGSSEELGVPVTIHQTILPLIHCFGKGLCNDGIDVLVRIGGLFGENFVVRHILPLLRNVVRSCVDVSHVNKPEPMQSWSTLAISDCLISLNGLVAVLPREVVVKELFEDGSCLHLMVLMLTNLEISVLQVAATSLIAVCQQIGPNLTALHVLPKLKDLFDELAFSQETADISGSLSRSLKVSKPKSDEEDHIESRMDLVFLLYPHFASLLGIEKLRQCCATWLLLEQFLLRCHNWKWEYTGESSRSGLDNINAKRPGFRKSSTSEYNPAKLLLNGVGWSIPQSQGNRSSKNLMPLKQLNDFQQRSVERHVTTSNFTKLEPWYWFPSPAASWDGPDFLGRVGGLKDELPWKIRASVISSVRAHHGALRSVAVCQDECTVFTAGVGPGFKGTVQKWDLSRINCISGYYGHEEVVNDICVLSSLERVASCDGTIHVWNSQTGKLISVFAESSASSAHFASPLAAASKANTDHPNMLNSNPLSSGILTSTFDGSLYTCMHHLEFVEKFVVGTGNGSLRFIDIARGQKLHLWRSESVESSFPSLISSICSCGSDKMQASGAVPSPSWIAAGLSSGICKLLDVRSGNVIASWRAHDGYVTKLAAPEDNLLVSSSLDKTLRIWDLRRNPSQSSIVIRGHNDSVSGFSVWGQDVISISRNKIGLSSLTTRTADEDGQHRVTPQHLYMADNGMRNMSVLSSISILPFSRLFFVGTEDGYLRVCC